MCFIKVCEIRSRRTVFVLYSVGLVSNLAVSLISLVFLNAMLVLTVESQSNNAYVVNQVAGLKLILSVNTTSIASGGAIEVVLDEVNTLTTMKTINASYSFPIRGLGASPCGALGSLPPPIGWTLFRGYHTTNDLWYGQLAMYSPGPYLCPLVRPPMKWYTFAADSDNASFYGYCGSQPCFATPMKLDQSFSGYWIVIPLLNSGSGSFSRFQPGVYTVVGGDEWGDLVLLHFAVL